MYLRQGAHSKLQKNLDKGKLGEKKLPEANMDIFEDIRDDVASKIKTPWDKEPERLGARVGVSWRPQDGRGREGTARAGL